MKILDVGCGKRKAPGAIGIDKRKTGAVDVICDLDAPHYPFADDSFDRVYITDVLEHLEDVIMVLEEVHRISRPGAEVHIRVPHFSSTHSYGDITHKHCFNSESFDYFTGDMPEFDFYTRAKFKRLGLRINFWKAHRVLGISCFANRFPLLYEKYLPFIFTAMNIEVTLKVVK